MFDFRERYSAQLHMPLVSGIVRKARDRELHYSVRVRWLQHRGELLKLTTQIELARVVTGVYTQTDACQRRQRIAIRGVASGTERYHFVCTMLLKRAECALENCALILWSIARYRWPEFVRYTR